MLEHLKEFAAKKNISESEFLGFYLSFCKIFFQNKLKTNYCFFYVEDGKLFVKYLNHENVVIKKQFNEIFENSEFGNELTRRRMLMFRKELADEIYLFFGKEDLQKNEKGDDKIDIEHELNKKRHIRRIDETDYESAIINALARGDAEGFGF